MRSGSPFGQHERPLFGRWAIDEHASRLVRDDRKELRFAGFVDDRADLGIANDFDRRWMRFEADLAGRPYSLLVERRDVAPGSGRRRLVWRLDHIRSARFNGLHELDFETWHGVDRLACDALMCWPETASTGLRPAEIAVSGGWQAGHWAVDRYRIFAAGRIDIKPPEGFFDDEPIEYPQMWQFHGASTEASAQREAELLRSFTQAAPHEVRELVEEFRHLRPHLASPTRLFIPFAFAKSSRLSDICWLYVDETLITDRLHTPPGLWRFQQEPGPIIGRIDYAQSDHASHKGVRHRDQLLTQWLHVLSSRSRARFREIVEEAIWHWQDCSVALPSIDGKMRHITINRPAYAGAERLVHVGNTVFTTSMTATRTVISKAGKPPSFTHAFDDGLTIAATPFRHGRFDFSPEEARMVDRVTGQVLVFEETLAGHADAASTQTGTFRYQDSIGSFSILVHRLARRNPHDGESWVVDYTTRGQPEESQDEVLWQHAQGFILDALLLWPDTRAFGPGPRNVVAQGGWLNGRWEPLLRRQKETSSLSLAGTAISPPIDLSERWPGCRWQHHPAPAGITGDEDLGLDPQDAVLVDPLDLQAFARDRLDCRRFWMRDDGKALLYICAYHLVRRGVEGDRIREPIFEYCDADVRVRLHLTGSGSIGLSSLHWPRMVRTSTVDRAKLLNAQSIPNGHCTPQDLLWRRLVDATDARLIGGGIGDRAAVRTTGAYVAGLLHSLAETSLWLGPVLR